MSIKKRNLMAIQCGDDPPLRTFLIEEGSSSEQQGVVSDNHICTALQRFLDHCLGGV